MNFVISLGVLFFSSTVWDSKQSESDGRVMKH